MGLRASSYIAAGVHLGAAGVAAITIRPGTEGTLVARSEYVATHETAWTLGWLAWIVAALTMVWWAIEMRTALTRRDDATGAPLAVIMIAIGTALETAAHCLSAGLLPHLSHDLLMYAAIERCVQLAGPAAAQIFFAGGTLLLVIALRRVDVSSAVLVLGSVNVAAGLAMMIVSGLALSAWVPRILPVLILALSAFLVSVARSEWAREADL